MEKPNYELESFENGQFHFFESKNTKGEIIKKVVAFSKSEENEDIYRLVFGDLIGNGKIDFYSSSTNNDMEIILNSVIKAIEIFFNHNPEKSITFTGSTISRTRLYRAVISKFMESKEPKYSVFGFTNENEIIIFDKNKTFIGYLIKKNNEIY